MRGGKRPRAGRKKGVPNKINAALREKLMAGGIAPLDYMLTVMRDPKAPSRSGTRWRRRRPPICIRASRLSSIAGRMASRCATS